MPCQGQKGKRPTNNSLTYCNCLGGKKGDTAAPLSWGRVSTCLIAPDL